MAITPYLYYEDVERASAFLAAAFGFRPFGVQMKAADEGVSHAAMKFAGEVIMMGRPPSGFRNPKRLGQSTQCLYINVLGVDRHFARAVAAGAVVLEAPTDTEYGHRRYTAADPEGHEWCFAEETRAKRGGGRGSARKAPSRSAPKSAPKLRRKKSLKR